MKCLIVITCIVALCRSGEALSSPLLLPDEVTRLAHIQEKDFLTFAQHDPAILEDFTPETVKVLTTSMALSMFTRALQRDGQVGPLEFFANETFQIRGHLLLLTRETLLEIDKAFNLHLIFEVSGRTAAPVVFEQKSIPNGARFVILALFCGNGGDLWVLYDHPVALRSKEYPVLGGRYDLFRTNRIWIRKDSKGRITSTMMGRNGYQERFRAISGPLNLPIEHLTLDEKRERFAIHFGIISPITVAHPSISRRMFD